ncbi:MAG: methyltransferase domain-containing protein [Pseudomonadota bacterium]|nr:methyltransferase domain-containing protein [Pseudomonadota bacterium]
MNLSTASERAVSEGAARDAAAHDDIRHYYGQVLQSSADLKTGACCPLEAMPEDVRRLLEDVHPEVKDRFYGCGSPLPPALDGMTVLDLGCGTGRDAYLLSRLVGERGRVIGVDMTAEQLEVASRHQDWHAQRYGHSASNVSFVQGYIEQLDHCGIQDASIDVVVSNCVLNLAPDKERVFAEIFRVLKPGGELYFSDVFSDRRIPQALRSDPVLLGECLSGALYGEDFRRLLARVGCLDARSVSQAPIPLLDPQIEAKIGMVGFRSATIRAFKLPLEDRCEDYGQIATYRGTIDRLPHAFVLDDHHRFQTARPMLVCGNTFDMLARSRYAGHFTLVGDTRVHHGLFECAAPPATARPAAACC